MITESITKFFSEIIVHCTKIASTEAIVFDLAIILILSAIFAFIAKLLKQPMIPAYVLAGAVISPLVLGTIKNTELIYALSEIGIALLLFSAGLEISFKKLKETGLGKMIFIGFIQVLSAFLIAFLIARLFSLNSNQSVYIAVILAFSSTMVVVKLFSDKKELLTMHGRLALAILVLQDLFAIFAVSILMSKSFALMPILNISVKLLIIIFIALILNWLILKRIFEFAAHSQELLFLFGLAILFLFILFARALEISIVIGAYIAGVLLANTDFKFELGSKISPLRDFFAILFFVALGMQISLIGIKIELLLLMILFPLIVKPALITSILRLFGYKSKTSFLAGISLAQLSEFSLIIAMIGFKMGIIDRAIFSTVILATIITMIITTYLIEYKNWIYQYIFRVPLKLFNFLPVKETLEYNDNRNKEVLLVGCHRMGSILLDELIDEKGKLNTLVIDFNPKIIKHLIEMKVPCIYGDISSPEILENINLNNLKLAICTAPNVNENITLLRKIKNKNKNTKIIVTATRISEAYKLYELGADYVILPKVIAGEDVLKIIKNHTNLDNIRKRHIRTLNNIHKLLY